MSGFKSLPLLGKIGLALCTGCLVFYIVAFCTNYWHVTTEVPIGGTQEVKRTFGLWYVCNAGPCTARGQRLATGVDQATQALESVGLALTILGLVMFVLKLLFKSLGKISEIGLTSVICLLAAVFFYLVGLIMWGVSYRPPIQAWSYVVAHITTLVQIPGSILLMMGSRD